MECIAVGAILLHYYDIRVRGRASFLVRGAS